MIPYKVFSDIKIGPLTIYTWGILVGLAFLASYLYTLYEAKRSKLDLNKITNLGLWGVIGAIIGARFLFVLENLTLFEGRAVDFFKIWQGGMSFYGGFGGALLAIVLYIKKAHLSYLRIFDILALAAPLGIFIGRIGCFLINDHLGEETRLVWAIAHPDGTMRHPVALYLSLSGLLCFVFLLIIKKKIKTRGILTALFLLWYSVSRFLLDFTRSKNSELPFSDAHYFGLTLSQYMSVVMFFVSIYLIIIFKKRYAQRTKRIQRIQNNKTDQ
jgi:phosphatidylglycerol:prolipoprotein diacylglycerol transferase